MTSTYGVQSVLAVRDQDIEKATPDERTLERPLRLECNAVPYCNVPDLNYTASKVHWSGLDPSHRRRRQGKCARPTAGDEHAPI